MIRVTLRDVLEGQGALQKLSNQQLPGRTAFLIGRLFKKLEDVLLVALVVVKEDAKAPALALAQGIAEMIVRELALMAALMIVKVIAQQLVQIIVLVHVKMDAILDAKEAAKALAVALVHVIVLLLAMVHAEIRWQYKITKKNKPGRIKSSGPLFFYLSSSSNLTNGSRSVISTGVKLTSSILLKSIGSASTSTSSIINLFISSMNTFKYSKI